MLTTLTKQHVNFVWTGLPLQATVSLSAVEMSKRRQMNQRGLISYDLQETLLSLPLGYPVSIDDLSDLQWRSLDESPDGVVRVSDRTVVRTLGSPLRVHTIHACGAPWMTLFRSLLPFHREFDCKLTLDSLPDDWESLAKASQRAGIEVSVGSRRFCRGRRTRRRGVLTGYIEEYLASSLLDGHSS